ncbi:MAG: methyltransferase [Desulfuromonadales bacterium]
MNRMPAVRKLQISQPKSGYRYSLDPVLLSSFAVVKNHERVLDLGCGVGVILLNLACQNKSAEMIGIEIQENLAALAEQNIAANGFSDRIRILHADLRQGSSEVPAGYFDVVVTNPPYRSLAMGRQADDMGKATARHELAGGLTDFLGAASGALKTGGRVYIIYLVERLAELLAEMRFANLEPKRLRTVHSRIGESAKMVMVEGRKNSKPGIVVEAPLMIYRGAGRDYTEEVLAMYQTPKPGNGDA